MLLKGERTFVVRDMGGFIVHVNMPGWVKPKPADHGHGPLAMVAETILHPGRLVAMHEHRNDEIISWVPDGVMRHEDRARGRLTCDSGHLMVMNAGRSFWHSEETLASDPPLRMLQILVRPEAVDLEPGIQHGPVPDFAPNRWRHLVGRQGGDAPFFVRNRIDLFDIRLQAGARADFPRRQGCDLYFYMFSGAILAGGQAFGEGEQGLLLSDEALMAQATGASVVVAFLIDRAATVMRQGTVGDHRKIPPPVVIRLLKRWQRLKRLWRPR
ncbi:MULTISPECIES: pirin family protein [unclassified Rhizobium]|uniref:pirin family protein n=1 Tax=Rhizobium sp. GCM10022189 TaxID=3252654 RepID=UPI00362438D9